MSNEPPDADIINEVKRKSKVTRGTETKRFPVIRMFLALVLLTAAVLLVFWRGAPQVEKSATGAPEKAPEVVLRPLPEGDAPQDRQTVEKPAPSSNAAKPEAVPAPAVGGKPKEKATTSSPQIREAPKPATVLQPSKPQYRKARLFFAAVGADGRIAIKGVIRPVPIGDSPLLDTLGSLLQGPTPQEINLGLLSMIPGGSRLLSASMKKDVVFLDFNEEFRYNKLGIEGQMAQLRQVVYAATEFSNVKKVQILIEGKKVDFLGAEGISVGKPLDRESLND
jgi:germination protein M